MKENDERAKKSTPETSQTPKKRKKITESYLENAGAYYLERFSASTDQFRAVLSRKIILSCRDHPDQDKETCLTMLESVVQKFTRLGYLDDTRYARQLYGTLAAKGLGHRRIITTMAQKGVPPDIVESIALAPSDDDDKKAALTWARKKRLGPFATRVRDDGKDMARGLASLARAGFSFSVAQWVIRQEKDSAEFLDNT